MYSGLASTSNHSNHYAELTCWDFSAIENEAFPRMIIEAQNPATGTILALSSKVDTGFNGVLGFTRNEIDNLALEPEGMTTVMTASGPTHLRYYKIIFSIPNTSLTSLQGLVLETPRTLIGRTVLNLGVWLYDGVSGKWCFMEKSL